MKKTLLSALSVSLLVLSVSANANQFLYTSIGDDGSGGDARLQGSFIYDTALSEYSAFNLTLDVGFGVVFSDFGFPITDNLFPQNTVFSSSTATNTSFATADLTLFDFNVKGNNGLQSPVTLNWAAQGTFFTGSGALGNIFIPQGGPTSIPPSTSFEVSAVVSAVPEPTTYAMMGIGLASLLGFRRYMA